MIKTREIKWHAVDYRWKLVRIPAPRHEAAVLIAAAQVPNNKEVR